MVGVAIWPCGLKIKYSILTRRGGSVANAPERSQIAMLLDWQFGFVLSISRGNQERVYPKVIFKIKKASMGPGLAKMSNGSIFLVKKMCTDSSEDLKAPGHWVPLKCSRIWVLGSGSPGEWIRGLPVDPRWAYRPLQCVCETARERCIH